MSSHMKPTKRSPMAVAVQKRHGLRDLLSTLPYGPTLRDVAACIAQGATVICGLCECEWPGPADGPCPRCGSCVEDHVVRIEEDES